MACAYIGFGSNLGDGRRHIIRAWDQLGALPGVTLERLSSPYSTAPVDMISTQWFTNAVGEITTTLLPEALLAAMLAIETALGRDRSKGRDRTVDLDLLYYDDLVLQMPGLTLPHPEIEHRLFVLAPLAEIAPLLCHPMSGKTTDQLRAALGAQHESIRQESWRTTG